MLNFEEGILSGQISIFKLFIEGMEEDKDLSGFLYNEYYGFALDFKNMGEMLSSLDELFNYVNFPMATHEKRSFQKSNKKSGKLLPANLRTVSNERKEGKSPTFILHVQFRQNATWQGTLTWIAENKVKRFRSELELIHLLTVAVEKEICKNSVAM